MGHVLRHHRRHGPSPSHRSTERRRLRNGQPNRNWWDALSRNAKVHLHVLVHPVLSRQVDNAPEPLSVLPVRSDPELPRVPAPLPAAPVPVVPAAPLSWSGTPSAVMAAATVAMQAGQALDSAAALVSTAQPCHKACANRWRRVSSCNCRSPQVVLRFLRRADRMEHLSAPVVMAPKPHPLFLGPRLRLRPLRRVDLDSDQVQALAASAVPVVPTGMTAPSWKRSATARLRSSARRSTSSAKTMIHLRRKPVDSPASRRTWCCRRAWLVLPSPSHSKEPHRNQWRRCASVARKRHVSVNAAGPWNCGQHAKPNRCGRK